MAYPGDDESPTFRGKGYAMTDDTIVQFRQPGSFSDDPLTEVLRVGARQLLGQAIEAEVEAHIAAHEHLTDRAGHRRIVLRLRQPLVLVVLRRTVAKVLSIGLVVRTCFQCSAGKS